MGSSSIYPAKFYISESILVKILFKLPVKSLMRFKCVDKLWYNLISSPHFTYMHASNNASTYLLLSCYDDDEKIKKSLISLMSPNLDSNLSSTNLELPQVLEKFGNYAVQGVGGVRGSCNGVICLQGRVDEIALWNPTIRDYKLLPPSNISRPGFSDNINWSEVGIGFDTKTNDYKILQTLSLDHNAIQFELYSLRSDSWKKLEPANYVRGSYDTEGPTSLSITNKNMICWIAVAKDAKLGSIWEIVSLDLSDEKFEIIKLPPNIATLAKDNYGMLFSFRDSIALITSPYNSRNHPRNDVFYDVWVSEDFRTLATNNSWIKMLSIRATDVGPSAYLKGFFGNEQLIFHNAGEDVVLYDLFTQETKHLGRRNLLYANSYEFKESIVSISKFYN